jgi:hypothetical protein
MADAPVIHIGENSPEKVAFDLMEKIAAVEGRAFSKADPQMPFMPGWQAADREWILNTYKECLRSIRIA